MTRIKDRTTLQFVTTQEPPSSEDPGRGDEHLRLYREHRRMLFGIAYRMLGSVADAEDMLQETFLRWQQTRLEEVQSPRALLPTILTRLCINHLESAKVRREQYYGEWLPEPLLGDPTDDISATALERDESLSMAFLILLERLTPAERAVLLLREVFDYDYPEIARMLNQTQANCRQLLRRARQHIASNRPRFTTSLEHHERLTKEFMHVVVGGNLQRLVEMLSQEAVLHSDGGGKARALPVRILGAGKVARALIGANRKFVPKTLISHLTLVNGQPGAVSYLEGRPFSVFTLDIEDGKISNVYIVTNPDKLAHLGASDASARN